MQAMTVSVKRYPQRAREQWETEEIIEQSRIAELN
jgi:hypothetical protein